MARPSFKPTAAQRRDVEIWAGGGMSHEEIALVLGISRVTLSKHLEAELSIGALRRRADVTKAMFAKAKKGSVPAARFYTATPVLPAAPPEPASGLDPDVEKPKLGKKAQANEDAKTAAQGTTWGNLLKPSSTVQ